MTTISTLSLASRRSPTAGAIAAVVVSLALGATEAWALTPIEELGKNVFFDDKLSHPSNKQACASCHNAARGWVLPNSKINGSTVVAPGAAPHAVGNIKTPSNAYASFSPPFGKTGQSAPLPPFRGGNFWDGRAEGCGATKGPCPVGTGSVSETIKPTDLPNAAYVRYLGPTADQALNPFPNTVEQNIREKNVCQVVKTAKYKQLYHTAFGADIDCSPNPKSNPAYSTSFKRVAVALAAWQSSDEVNSRSSRRDDAIEKGQHFPLPDFNDEENLGHDLFYGITSDLNNTGKNARCAGCHNGVPQGDTPDAARGEALRELYTDNAFHNIGTPFNREIPGVLSGQKVGLSSHVPVFFEDNVKRDLTGLFKTPTLRNVAKGVDPGFVKAYSHNGWFKSLKSIVHFYNTRDSLRGRTSPPGKCEELGIRNATEAEALKNDCWPPAEFPSTQAGFVIGNLRLTPTEEDAIVAYMKTLTDLYTPTPP